MLRKASELKHWFGILGIVLLDCLLGVVIFFGPVFLGLFEVVKVGRDITDPTAIKASPTAFFAIMFTALNTIDFLACSMFFVLMGLMLLHRLVWPILEGPIYFFQRFGLIERKVWLSALAVGLLFGKDIWTVVVQLIAKR